MAEANTLHDAFLDELRDSYDAEKQLTKALTKLAKAAAPAGVLAEQHRKMAEPDFAQKAKG